MWNPFRKEAVQAPKPEETYTLHDAIAQIALASRIDSEIQKSVDDSILYSAYNAGKDTGNYFGSEFNIVATSGRIKSTYSREPWIFATATLLARTLSSIPFHVVNNVTGEVDNAHPMNKQLKTSSMLQDNATIRWNGFLDLVLGGNCYLVFNESYSAAMIVPCEDVTVKVKDNSAQIDGYVITSQKQNPKFVKAQYVVHNKYPNPFNPYYGMSIYTAASRPVLLDRYKNEFEMAFYLRGATNSGVIETSEDIAKSRLERFLSSFEQSFTGKRNWWRTIFLPKGAKWVSSGLTMNEMQHLEGLRENRLTLLAVLGIPPSLVGITGDVNRATSETQEATFWKNTIKPLADFYASGWNNSYLVQVIYRNQIRIEPDLSGIEALKGSFIARGEQAKAVESYMTLNEIRAKILKIDPLPVGDARGDKLVAEIKPAAASPFGSLGLSAPGEQPQQIEGAQSTDMAQPESQDPEKEIALVFTSAKATAIASQERVEEKLTAKYLGAFETYMKHLLDIATFAIANRSDIRGYIKSKEKELARVYVDNALPILERALDRGFSVATSQSKSISELTVKFKSYKNKKKATPRFTETDEQAIDAIRERDLDGQRTQLSERAIKNFLGFNETRTEEIMSILEDGLKDGQTIDQVAANIRQTYGEKYPNQANTIARTELLGAVSQGLKWNNDVLSEVFTETQKEWFSVDDASVRPDHLEFEKEGPVEKNHKWGGELEYPRDPNGNAKQIINCRCTMVTTIPQNAQSNAAVILDNLV